MTTTKMMYLAAAILPFGFVVLAGVVLVHAMYVRHKNATARAVATAAH